jgi:hypothetical protein
MGDPPPSRQHGPAIKEDPMTILSTADVRPNQLQRLR